MGEKLQKEVEIASPPAILQSLGRSGMKFTLGRVRSVLKHLGNPQNKFPAIHIAGTNGKGSVAVMLAAVLRQQNLNVGLYTSPHLETLNERFQINRKPISTALLNRKIKKLYKNPILRRFPLTQFEFLTVIAFQWFQERNVDVAIIETGLGGRLDATNVMENVMLSLITTIGHDHTDWLGHDLNQIAWEKAGIIKPGVPVVTSVQGSALHVIRQVAHQKRSPLTVSRKRGIPPVSFKGNHQKRNAGLVDTALRVLSEGPIVIQKNKNAYKNLQWPGRFEVFKKRGTTFILDGAHNPEAVLELVKTLKTKKIRRVNVVMGVLKDKEVDPMVRALSPLVNRCLAVPVPSNRSFAPAQLAQKKAWKGKAVEAPNLKHALKRPSRYPVLVTGSLYLVGEARKIIRQKF